MYFHFRGPGTVLGGPEPMVDLFVREIRQGIGDTGVRAGILKCASDRPGITPGVERVLRAVARAHRETGVPITTHTPTPPEPWGLEQQRVFREEGVDLSRVVIGHSGGTVNTDYHLSLIDNGSYLGFDHFGLPGITLEERVDAVGRLCERGYAERIVLVARRHVLRGLVPALGDGRVAVVALDLHRRRGAPRHACARHRRGGHHDDADGQPAHHPRGGRSPTDGVPRSLRRDAAPDPAARAARRRLSRRRGVAQPRRRVRAHPRRVAPAIQPSRPGPPRSAGSGAATGSGSSSAATSPSSGSCRTWRSTRPAGWPSRS